MTRRKVVTHQFTYVPVDAAPGEAQTLLTQLHRGMAGAGTVDVSVFPNLSTDVLLIKM